MSKLVNLFVFKAKNLFFYCLFIFNMLLCLFVLCRSGKNVMMASSDVSARGMDYPDVTFVLQVGMTDRDQYIHR